MLGLISAIFLVVSYPPIGWWGCSFLVPVPIFILALRPVISPARAGLYASIAMMPGWWWVHQWIATVSAAGLIPLVIYLSLYTLLFVWLGNRVIRRWGHPSLVLPVVWIGLEFARSTVVLTGYPWYLSAHPLIDAFDGFLALPASIAGVHLVSLFVVGCSMGIVGIIGLRRNRQHAIRSLAGTIGVLVVWILVAFIAGFQFKDSPDPTMIRAAVIQPDVAQDNRQNWTVRQRVRDWLMLRDLSYQAARDERPPDVIVWPEGFVPGWTLDPQSLETERNASVGWNLTLKNPDDVPDLDMPSMIGASMVVDELLLFQEAIGIPMIVGSVAYDNLQIIRDEKGIEYKNAAMYNSAFVLRDGAPDPIWYDKLHLTPFGEVMPYISSWSWLENKLLGFGAEGMAFVLSPGESPRLLRVPTATGEHPIATPICFEATLSGVCRALVYEHGERRTGLMVNITNDGWFNTWNAGRKTHQLMARWRCVELATPMIRCANTGVSGVIDRRGQVRQGIEFFDAQGRSIGDSGIGEGFFLADVELAQGVTAYARIGDTIGWLSLAIAIVGGFLIKKRRTGTQSGTTDQQSGTINGSTQAE